MMQTPRVSLGILCIRDAFYTCLLSIAAKLIRSNLWKIRLCIPVFVVLKIGDSLATVPVLLTYVIVNKRFTAFVMLMVASFWHLFKVGKFIQGWCR